MVNNNLANKILNNSAAYNIKIIDNITSTQLDNVTTNFFSSSAAQHIGYMSLVWFAGAELVIGYEYKNGMFGYQQRMGFTGQMQYRYKNNTSTWSAWTVK